MSQVFFFYPHIDHSVVLLFKDSIGGTAEPKVPDRYTSFKCTHESKSALSMLITRRRWPGPLTKFRGPAIARPLRTIDAAPNATLRSLHLAGLRRGLARIGYFVMTDPVRQQRDQLARVYDRRWDRCGLGINDCDRDGQTRLCVVRPLTSGTRGHLVFLLYNTNHRDEP
jgi:hypothetical protein